MRRREAGPTEAELLAAEKKSLRLLMQDFHPDKFMQAGADAEDQRRSNEITQMLNALWEIN